MSYIALSQHGYAELCENGCIDILVDSEVIHFTKLDCPDSFWSNGEKHRVVGVNGDGSVRIIVLLRYLPQEVDVPKESPTPHDVEATGVKWMLFISAEEWEIMKDNPNGHVYAERTCGLLRFEKLECPFPVFDMNLHRDNPRSAHIHMAVAIAGNVVICLREEMPACPEKESWGKSH